MDMYEAPKTRNYFKDKLTKIDFVLVWRETRETDEANDSLLGSPREFVERKSKMASNDLIHRTFWRKTIVETLQKASLLVEKETNSNPKFRMHYIKMSAPFELLCYYAEKLSLNIRLQEKYVETSTWSGKLLTAWKIPNIMTDNVPNQPTHYYTCPFHRSHLDWLLGIEKRNPDNLFTNVQRTLIVYEILCLLPFGKPIQLEAGVNQVLRQVFQFAYPLHDGPYEIPEDPIPFENLNQRQILYHFWANWKKWFKYQPLDHVHQYFGAKIALFFAFLGYYTTCLVPLSICGMFSIIFGIFQLKNAVPVQEVCNSHEKICAPCRGCQEISLSSSCSVVKATFVIDHVGTVFLTILVSIWAVTFLKYWKRKCTLLTFQWNYLKQDDSEEPPRPEFMANTSMVVINPVTGLKEPYFPENLRMTRVLTSTVVIAMMVIVVMIFLVFVILYRSMIIVFIYKSKTNSIKQETQLIANVCAGIVSLAVIVILDLIYTPIAEMLTRTEMHRTQTEFEESFTLKLFVFQFFNMYSSLFYIAFLKPRNSNYPGAYLKVFGIRTEDCGSGSCMLDLSIGVAVIMGGRQIINILTEMFIPAFTRDILSHRRSVESMYHQFGEEGEPWEVDYKLMPYQGLIREYMEIVLQYGFVTLFAAAFPLGPLFALIHNCLDIRLSARKFVCMYQRPVAGRARTIGVWMTIMEVMTQIAVISNAFQLAFTSEFLPQFLYGLTVNRSLRGYVNFTLSHRPGEHSTCKYRSLHNINGIFHWRLIALRLMFIVCFEHAVLVAQFGFQRLIPEVSESLRIKLKRQHYLSKRAQGLETIEEHKQMQSSTHLIKWV